MDNSREPVQEEGLKTGSTTSRKTARRWDFHWSRRTDLHVTGTDGDLCAEVGLPARVDTMSTRYWTLDGCQPPETQPREDRIDMGWVKIQSAGRFLEAVHLWRSAQSTSTQLKSYECWVFCWLQTCHSTSTSQHSALGAFSSWGNCAAFDDHWMTTPSPHSFMP